MLIVNSPVKEIKEIQKDIFLQKIYSPEIARQIKPGQFLNIRVSETVSPLLRRPFSICDVEGDYIFIMFNIFGEGTRILSHKHSGDTIDILGPLGNGFNLDDDFDLAVIVAGGLGSAPFPFLTRLLAGKVEIVSFIGGKTKDDVITYNLLNAQTATNDGSLGFPGNVVQLFEKNINSLNGKKVKVFGCGPNAMLRALKEVCITHNINCEVSTECAMACGFGICQGCPIESTQQSDKYLLVCKDGPVFNVKDVVI